MKKRVLSFLIALSVVCSNCSPAIMAIAEDGELQNSAEPTENNLFDFPDDAETSDDKEDSLQSDDSPADEPEQNVPESEQNENVPDSAGEDSIPDNQDDTPEQNISESPQPEEDVPQTEDESDTPEPDTPEPEPEPQPEPEPVVVPDKTVRLKLVPNEGIFKYFGQDNDFSDLDENGLPQYYQLEYYQQEDADNYPVPVELYQYIRLKYYNQQEYFKVEYASNLPDYLRNYTIDMGNISSELDYHVEIREVDSADIPNAKQITVGQGQRRSVTLTAPDGYLISADTIRYSDKEYNGNEGEIGRIRNDEVKKGTEISDKYFITDAEDKNPRNIREVKSGEEFTYYLKNKTEGSPEYGAVIARTYKEIELKVNLKEEKLFSFYGQQLPDLNNREYYDLEFADPQYNDIYTIPEEVYQNLRLSYNQSGEEVKEIGMYSVVCNGVYYYQSETGISYVIPASAEEGKFEIREYKVSDEIIEQITVERNGKGQVTLTAPDGYRLRIQEKYSDRKYHQNQTIPAENGVNIIHYYLKSSDGAVSEERELKFFYNADPLEVQPDAVVKTAEEGNPILNFLTFGIFSNGSVSITVKVKGGAVPSEDVKYKLTDETASDVTVILRETDTSTPIQLTQKADRVAVEGGNYYYYATFVIENKNIEQARNMKFRASVFSENFTQESENHPSDLVLREEKNNEYQTSIIMIEANLPIFEEIQDGTEKKDIVFDNYEYCKIRVSDTDSGLDKLEYHWGNGSEGVISFRDFNAAATENIPGVNVTYFEPKGIRVDDGIYVIVKPEDIITVDNKNQVKKADVIFRIPHGNAEKLTAWLTDNADNVSDPKEFPVIVPDYAKPEIKDFKIIKQADQKEINVYPYGAFSNTYALDFVVTAKDPRDPDEPETEHNSYHTLTVMSPDEDYIREHSGQKSYYYDKKETPEQKPYYEDDDYILSVSSNEFSPEFFQNLIVDVADGFHHEIKKFSDFNLNDGAYNTLMIENERPSVTFTHGENVVGYDAEGRLCNENDRIREVWYGEAGKEDTIMIDLSDNQSGIAEISVSLDGETLQKYCYNYTSEAQATPTTHIEIPFSELNLEDGSHTITVKVIDNAGNISAEGESSYSFHLDTIAPSGTITSGPEPYVMIDNLRWFDGDTDVTFTFNNQDENPYTVEWDINGKNNFEAWKSANEEKAYESEYTISEVEAARNLNAAYIYDTEKPNQFTVTATFIDRAGNHSEAETTVYKDFARPHIDSVTVSRAQNAIDQILNLLTFGIYSNEKIRFTVNASDEFSSGDLRFEDSGLYQNNIDSVYIRLNPNAEYQPMQYQKDKGNYIYDVPLDTEIKSGTVQFKVVDKFGEVYEQVYSETDNYDPVIWQKHSTESFPAISRGTDTESDISPEYPGEGDSTDSREFMLERKAPDVSISVPPSDGIQREDGTIWYNSNKNIDIDIQDSESGIRDIQVTVTTNDTDVVVFDSDSTGNEFLKAQQIQERETGKQHYVLSTDAVELRMAELNLSPEDGAYVISVTAEDNAGNKTTEGALYYIDKTNPQVDLINFSIETADGIKNAAEFISILEYGFYFERELTAEVQVSDAPPSSGMYIVEYHLVEYQNGTKVGDTSDVADIDEEGHASFTVPANFKGQIYVRAFDNTLNSSEEVTPQSFVVDTPERHDSEEHIFIPLAKTDYHDNEENLLYVGSTSVSAVIQDTVSGIQEIRYGLKSEKDTQELQTIVIPNNGNYVGQSLGDGWEITAMDENLVTEVSRYYTFAGDNNDIQIQLEMTDRANNTSEKESEIFSVDSTAPVIRVEFDSPAGSKGCYREARTASITVIDRNIDIEQIKKNIVIRNTLSPSDIPEVSFGDSSEKGSEYHAEVTFEQEGDYTFTIGGNDLAGHAATVSYSGENEFHIDTSNIRFTEENGMDDIFRTFENDKNNTFKEQKTMNISFTEHNFSGDAGTLHMHIYRVPAGQEMTEENRIDCIGQYMTGAAWNHVPNTDIYEIAFTFETGYLYQVVFGDEDGMPADTSGRTLAAADGTVLNDIIASPVFEIDTVSPQLVTPRDKSVVVYTGDKEKETPEVIEFDDVNMKEIRYTLTIHRFTNSEMSMDVLEDRVVRGNTITLEDKYFKSDDDGIYELKCTAYDIAGNESETSVHTYVIQRKSEFLAYIPGISKGDINGLYLPGVSKERRGISSDNFSDITIEAYLLNANSVGLRVGEQEVPVCKADSTGKENKLAIATDESINQVTHYTAVLGKSYIAEKYAGVNDEFPLVALCMDSGNVKEYRLGYIVLDNNEPQGEYSDLENGASYYVNSKPVNIVGVSPDVDIDKCDVRLTYNASRFNDKDTSEELTLTIAENKLDYDMKDSGGIISFNLEEGYYDSIKATLYDYAGNDYKMKSVDKVYVGDFYKRWAAFIVAGVALVLLVIAAIATGVYRKIKANRTSL